MVAVVAVVRVMSMRTAMMVVGRLVVVLADQSVFSLICDHGASYGTQCGLELALVAQLVTQHATADAADSGGYETFLAILGLLVVAVVAVMVVVLRVARAVIFGC